MNENTTTLEEYVEAPEAIADVSRRFSVLEHKVAPITFETESRATDTAPVYGREENNKGSLLRRAGSALRTYARKTGTFLQNHLNNSTAILIPVIPYYAFADKAVALFSSDMTVEKSFAKAKLSALLTYAGMSYIYNTGLKKWNKMRTITSETDPRKKFRSNMIYTGLYSATTTPFILLGAGVRDAATIAGTTAVAVASGFIIGGAIGLSVDTHQDLRGLRHNDQLPLTMEGVAQKLEENNGAVKGYVASKLRGGAQKYRGMNQLQKSRLADRILKGAIGLTAAAYAYGFYKAGGVEPTTPTPIVQVNAEEQSL